MSEKIRHRGLPSLIRLKWPVLIILSLFLEVFVFNFRYWQSRNYEPLEIVPLAMDEQIVPAGDSRYSIGDGDAGLYFSDFDVHVNNICVDVENTARYKDSSDTDRQFYKFNMEEQTKRVAVQMLFTDASNHYGVRIPSRNVVSCLEKTKYIPLHLAGNSTYLRISFPESNGSTLRINKIVLNAPVPFSFSLARFFLVTALLLLGYALRPHSGLYRIPLDLRRRGQKPVLAAVLAVQILFSMGLTSQNISMTNLTYGDTSLYSPFYTRYARLAESLLNGRLDIDVRSEEDMAEVNSLDNPYDPSLLTSKGLSWTDYAHYNGRYYVYFGIVPCLLFNVPFRLLTGKNLASYPCFMILLPFFIAAAFALVHALIKRFLLSKGRSIPFVTYLLLSLLFVNGCALSYQYASPDAYFLPIFTGLFFMMLGLTLWTGAVRQGPEGCTLSGRRLFFGSLCMALTAGCRPQLLIAMFLAVPLFRDAVFRDRLLLSRRSRAAVKNTLLFVLPIVFVACCLFWYNYARFGNIFDFGANYNETNNDMTTRGFQPYRALQGLFYYIFQFPIMRETFPYIASGYQPTAYTGTSIILETLGGILWMQPAVWCLFLLKTVRKECGEAKALGFLRMLIVFGVIVPCVDSMMAGIVDRYCMDFYWTWGLAAAVVLAFVSVKAQGSAFEADLRRVTAVLLLLTLVISVQVTLTHDCGMGAGLSIHNPVFFSKIQSLVEFWQ